VQGAIDSPDRNPERPRNVLDANDFRAYAAQSVTEIAH
jgi:hypothetical protein